MTLGSLFLDIFNTLILDFAGVSFEGKIMRLVRGSVFTGLGMLTIASVAFASSLVPSDFEDETTGESTTDSSLDVQYWTAVNQLIDLGVTEIAGCTTIDQSDYTQLRDYETESANKYSAVSGLTKAEVSQLFAQYRADNDLTNYPSAFSAFDTRVDVKNQAGKGNVLTLRINSASASTTTGTVANDASESAIRGETYPVDDGFVLHGPAVFSDPFVASAGTDLSFDWRAETGGDDYKAYAYLMNVDDCSQQVLVDATGNATTWNNSATATVSADGTYRFVFVAGTFDQSFGSYAGGALSIDNVELPTFTTAAGGSFAGPIVSGVGSTSSFSHTPSPGQQSFNMFGSRFGSLTKAFVGDIEVDFQVLSDGEVSISIPAGLSAGLYDVRLLGTLGNVTRIQALEITEAFSSSSMYGDPKVWTVRVSDEQAKLYAKFPEVGTKVRFGHQTGGSGDYETVFVKTIESESDESFITNQFGKYVVRTIDLEPGINRIRISVDDDRQVQVRYNR